SAAARGDHEPREHARAMHQDLHQEDPQADPAGYFELIASESGTFSMRQRSGLQTLNASVPATRTRPFARAVKASEELTAQASSGWSVQGVRARVSLREMRSLPKSTPGESTGRKTVGYSRFT